MAIVLTVVTLVNEIKKVIKLGITLEIDIVYQKKKKKKNYILMSSLLTDTRLQQDSKRIEA